MIPTLVPKPFYRDGWVYDRKEDGWRRVVAVRPPSGVGR
jgi:hypothetical protein